MQVNLETI